MLDNINLASFPSDHYFTITEPSLSPFVHPPPHDTIQQSPDPAYLHRHHHLCTPSLPFTQHRK
ncbi:formin-like protein 6 [Iris pallida]|uniref:Formin-like protein 6 n=1 Tax=Iris pallida TaxID=29817 RepID=A0AAX6DQ71_IRIPA|nr:formin-like protein 6 [Iris pallida]